MKEYYNKQLKEFYINKNNLWKQDKQYLLIKANKKEILKKEVFNDAFNHCIDLLPSNFNLELLYNIDWSSVLWEYFRNIYPSCTNGLFQELKQDIVKNSSFDFNSSKLNNRKLFNDLFSLLLVL